MSRELVISKNNLFFLFLLLGYLFGVILYDFLGFNYTDELMALFLAGFAVSVIWERKSWKGLLPLIVILSIGIFYIIYSFIIRSNVPQAIIGDFLIQVKPYIGFFCTYLIAPRLSVPQKRFFCLLCIIVGGFLLIVGLTGNIYPVFGHPARLATASTVTAFLFLYCSTYNKSDVIVFILLLSVGFFSTRAKFYGFWAVASCILLYSKLGGKLRFDWKTFLVIICVLGIGAWAAREKIILYYVDGMMNSREMWSRPAMMLASGQILLDFFPFGSGLGSFGTYMSGIYYSPIYAQYGLDQLWGLTRDNHSFVADAFYPSLAEFGIVGVLCYIVFWYYVLKRLAAPVYGNPKAFYIVICVFLFFAIEGVADATFTHNRGLFMLILLAMTLNIRKYEIKQPVI